MDEGSAPEDVLAVFLDERLRFRPLEFLYDCGLEESGFHFEVEFVAPLGDGEIANDFLVVFTLVGEFGVKPGDEFIDAIGGFGSEPFVGGEQSVTDAVLRDLGFAGFGFRAAGKLGVLNVCKGLCRGCHLIVSLISGYG